MTIGTASGRYEQQRLGSSVSFSRSRGPSQQADDEEDIQFSAAPYIQTYLAHNSRLAGCCGDFLPIPFERAAPRSWWDPRFDSDILEGQYRHSVFPQFRLRFQYALLYILTVSLSWFVYFVTTGLQGKTNHWIAITITFSSLFLFTSCVLVFTCTDFYRHHPRWFSAIVAIVMTLLSLALIIFDPTLGHPADITPVGQFSLCVEILLLIYTVIPLPLYLAVSICSVYSVAFEVLTAYLNTGVQTHDSTGDYGFAIRALLQLSVHLIGFHILIMTKVRMRGTFMKVGQSLLVRRQLEMEQQMKQTMIHSVMPPKVAAWLMSETGGWGDDEIGRDTLKSKRGSTPGGNDVRSLFRPFNMHHMENVSILFADIVGFTKMSSNKTAEELVGILNDLFERFDDLCAINGCEKISTLGDCYYCVAGCPEPKLDHAKSCVEMGLGMIDAIKQFDSERNEGVNMRVGVHTGTVLCGIVGKKRFKFDVWSNDVSLANQMESTGKPGRVHISQATAQFLGEIYVLEEGEPLHGLNTYFIKGRKADITYESFLRQKSSKIFPILIAPPPSSPLLAPQSRPRVLSCIHPVAATKRPHYLHLMTSGSLPNSVSQIKASSLPSILDSDNEAEELVIKQKEGKKSKSPVSLSGGGQSSPKGKPWLYQKTNQIKPEEIEPLGVEIFSPSSPSELRPEIKENEPSSQQVDNLRDAVRIEPAVMQLEVPGPMNNDDQLSVCLSVYSRKDSGIRSNSRRSSIQQQLFVMNGLVQGELLTHRVSGYYTSSQSTLNDESDTNFKKVQLPGPLSDSFGTCFHKLRKQSDLQLIRCVQDNVTSHHSYFTKPPLSRFTVFFRQKEMEREYRARAHRINEKHGGSPPTLATSRFNTYFDILISALVYTMIAISLFLLFEISPEWIAVCVVATFIQIFAVSLCVRQLLRPQYGSRGSWEFSKKIFDILSQWYPWHICGAVLVSLPIVSILVNFTCLNSLMDSSMDYYFSYLLFVGLVHFCNFTQLNCWMKSVLASVAGIIYVSLVACQFCPPIIMGSTSHNLTQTESTVVNADNLKTVLFANTTKLNASSLTQSPSVLNTTSSFGGNVILKNADFYTYNLYQNEIFLDVLLLLVLVWFLNREFEISYRLSFHGNIVAAKDKARVQNMKDQADLLLHNIIPKHVADTLKNTAKYSENHKDVGIIFASIVNFNEMYDESYLGGKEYLRVLNELIADFDDLLAEPQFRNVEKIKTIGSTFMAASGLNPEVRRQSRNAYEHLFELMDFAMAMQKVVDNFNRDLLEFNLILRVGYNFGDVTAGVIGTTKLYYDIWGDAVNIASRMDSTGIRGRIQVGENCISVLSERYLFEPRGYVYVKGKDNMMVYLVKGKCEDICIDNG